MDSTIKKYLSPKQFKINILKHFSTAAKNKRIQIENNIPKVNLTQKHVSNCELLLDRSFLLSKLKKNAVVAEIGVANGEFSESIINITQPTKLHLIDIWGNQRYDDELYNSVKNKFKEHLENKNVIIHRNLSTKAVDKFPDNYFDWIYLDTDHSYELTKEELQKYSPKVKSNGVISGHDYAMGQWITSYRYGVIEAVHEFCVNYNWELIYLTIETIETRSFAIRRIAR